MQWGKELLECQIPGLHPPQQKKKCIAHSNCSKKGPSQAELMQAQLHEREQQLAQKEHELEEREHWLKQPTGQHCMPTPPQNPCQSTPCHSHENSERHSTKLEGEDEIEDGGWSEGEGEMEDEEDSHHAIQKDVRVWKVIKRRADDEMEVNDEAEELIGEYRCELKKFEIEKAKALEHPKASRAQAKEGGHAEKDNRSNEVESQSVKKKKEVISALTSKLHNAKEREHKHAGESHDLLTDLLEVLGDINESEVAPANSQLTMKAWGTPVKKHCLG
ncbi:hypothetical protein CPB84DRAFT_1744602 [Gymnopilus junonius]|uniref:Uncharacterized protein n=1 Tax=Gymnopilus junonius TaxID=109634 RepID=A0A9P5NV19_GYMJU|nr:hypothetical protein CPB84DRAFT_1744602 [Gymnopilus junonius]